MAGVGGAWPVGVEGGGDRCRRGGGRSVGMGATERGGGGASGWRAARRDRTASGCCGGRFGRSRLSELALVLPPTCGSAGRRLTRRSHGVHALTLPVLPPGPSHARRGGRPRIASRRGRAARTVHSVLTPPAAWRTSGVEPAGRVLVLGAGFSRAVSDRMPLTDDLGRLVLRDLQAEGLSGPAGGFTGGYFEAWLSRLAEPQPDLCEWENLANQAWFSRITEQVRTVLLREQRAVLADAAPGWLLRLVAVLHRTRTTVVTFNYDLLLEAALNSALLAGPGGTGRTTSHDAT